MASILKFGRSLYRLCDMTLLKTPNNVIFNGINNRRRIFPLVLGQKQLFYCTDNENHSNDSIFQGLNTKVDIQELTKNDAETEKKLKLIILEADVLRQDGHSVPDLSFLKQQHWSELLTKPSRSQRMKYLKFLFKIEKKKENRQIKKEKVREERDNRPEYVDDGHIRYGLGHNTFLLRIYDTTMNQLYNHSLVNAMIFGQKLVVDCGYDANMTKRECQNAAKQIMLMFADNRMSKEPFDLHLCNAHRDALTINALYGHLPTMYESWFPLNIHECSYLDLFPKNQLCYLTPHCRDELIEFDHDTTYIIGGIVDKVNNEPLSLAKAKKEGIKMAKLPLDRFLRWGSGSGKNLTLNQMLDIMMDVKNTGDWNVALRHVPRRKINDEEPIRKFGKRFESSGPSWDRNEDQKRPRKKDFVKKLMNR